MTTYTLQIVDRGTVVADAEDRFYAELRLDGVLLGDGFGEYAAGAATEAVANGVSDRDRNKS